MNDKVVYTVVTGDYDELRPPETRAAAGWDWVCFTDAPKSPRTAPWQLRPIPWQSPDSVRLSRFPKLNPHIVLPEYAHSLYVDANIRVSDELLARADAAIVRGETCAMCRHPARDCAYQEAKYILRIEVGEPSEISAQVKFLLAQKYPAHAGLYQCNLMLREHNNPQIVRFSEAWWEIFSRFSRRDQMSVGWALREVALTPVELLTPAEAATLVLPHPPKPRRSIPARIVRIIRRELHILRLAALCAANGITLCE